MATVRARIEALQRGELLEPEMSLNARRASFASDGGGEAMDEQASVSKRVVDGVSSFRRGGAVKNEASGRHRDDSEDAKDALDCSASRATATTTTTTTTMSAFERASESLAIARAIERTLRWERRTVATRRALGREEVEASASRRLERAERAYEALREEFPTPENANPRSRGEFVDEVSPGDARSIGRSDSETRREDSYASFSFGGAVDGADSYDAGGAETSASVADAFREIDGARRDIANIMRSLESFRANACEPPPPRRDDDRRRHYPPSSERAIVLDRIAMIDGVLAALSDD
jgi:hypothetical protein